MAVYLAPEFLGALILTPSKMNSEFMYQYSKRHPWAYLLAVKPHLSNFEEWNKHHPHTDPKVQRLIAALKKT